MQSSVKQLAVLVADPRRVFSMLFAQRHPALPTLTEALLTGEIVDLIVASILVLLLNLEVALHLFC